MSRRSFRGLVARATNRLLAEWAQRAPEPVTYWQAHFTSQLPGLRRLGTTAKSRRRIELD